MPMRLVDTRRPAGRVEMLLGQDGARIQSVWHHGP